MVAVALFIVSLFPPSLEEFTLHLSTSVLFLAVTLRNTCDHSNVNLLICVYLPTDYGTEYSVALLKLLVNLKVSFSVPVLIVATSMLT